MRCIYICHVNLKWNLLRVSVLIGLAALGIGCGGLNASHSVSPASFFLPGLGQNSSTPQNPAFATRPAEVASIAPALVQ
jgi:hypothetical protein